MVRDIIKCDDCGKIFHRDREYASIYIYPENGEAITRDYCSECMDEHITGL